MDLSGRVAVVTGAGSGIGRASASLLASHGVRVVVADIDEQGGRETVDAIAGNGGEAFFVAVDVTVSESVTNLYSSAAEHFGGIDIAHNNAGIVAGNPPWPDTPMDRLMQLAMVNLGGVMLCTRAAVDHLRKRGGGAIVNTASIAGQFPMADDAAYSATKAGVLMFTQACAALRDRDGIRVNAVLPGLVDTPIINKTGDGTKPADWLVAALEVVPPLKPEEVAQAVLELIVDDDAYSQLRPVMAGL
jgi:NAD(P)-dependent dehydrogenase (short-subunit alcohol dehydrogenase family)